jgi:RNA polymerase sigma-70 factor (ECF subfamily)
VSLTLASQLSVNRAGSVLVQTAGATGRVLYSVKRSVGLFHPPIRILHQMDAVISWIQNPMEHDRAKLAQALRGGDPGVLDDLIAKYQHRLFRYLLSLTGNRATAEDIFQETWLRVLERGHQYRAQWKFEVWLFSIARHLVIDLARRKKVDSLEDLTAGPGEAPLEPPAVEPTALEQVLAGEQSVRLTQLLNRIPSIYREVLTLRFQEDLALEEMATIIKVPLATVKSRLYRGLDTLRREIEAATA